MSFATEKTRTSTVVAAFPTSASFRPRGGFQDANNSIFNGDTWPGITGFPYNARPCYLIQTNEFDFPAKSIVDNASRKSPIERGDEEPSRG